MFEFIVPFLIGTALGIEPMPMDAQIELATTENVMDEQIQVAAPASVSSFSPKGEVKPLLVGTQNKWVAVRANETQDLLYFTHLLSWRCGLASVAYGVNGAPPTQPIEMEPCYSDTSAPNALNVTGGYAPYLSFDANSIETITVAVAFADGTSDLVTFDRSDVSLQ